MAKAKAKPALDEKRIARLVEKWRARLLPREWSIGVRVVANPAELDEAFRDAFAYTEVEGAYLSAKVTFNARRFADTAKSDDFVNLVACHEVLHVVLHESEHLVAKALRDDHLAEVVNENAVERLSRALVRLERGE